MPKIENTSVINQAKPICAVLKARGENLSAETAATILVRAILEELGELDLLNDKSPQGVEVRRDLLKLAKPFMTAAKNVQGSYFAHTMGDDGTPLMPQPKATEQGVAAEFV